MEKQLRFKGFQHQVVCNGQSVVLIIDEKQAKEYVKEHLTGSEVIILPIATFEYT